MKFEIHFFFIFHLKKKLRDAIAGAVEGKMFDEFVSEASYFESESERGSDV
jgi:hypothetical protein